MHPYKQLPDRNFWNRAVSPVPWAEMFAGEMLAGATAAAAAVATA